MLGFGQIATQIFLETGDRRISSLKTWLAMAICEHGVVCDQFNRILVSVNWKKDIEEMEEKVNLGKCRTNGILLADGFSWWMGFCA